MDRRLLHRDRRHSAVVAQRRPGAVPAAIALAIRWWLAPGRPALRRRAAALAAVAGAACFQPAADRARRRQPGRGGRAQRSRRSASSLFGAILLQPQLRRMDAVPDFGDPLFSMWRMGWVYEQWRGDPAAAFQRQHLLPRAARADLLRLDAPAVGRRRSRCGRPGVHPVVAYNVLFLSAFVFSALATYLLVERLTGSSRAAFVSALIYGFYPYRFEHYSHLELQMTYWMPLALIWLHRFSADAQGARCDRRRAPRGGAALLVDVLRHLLRALRGRRARHAAARGAAAAAAAARARRVGAGAWRSRSPCRWRGRTSRRRRSRAIATRAPSGSTAPAVGLFPRAPAERDLRRPAARRSLSRARAVSRHAAPGAVRRGARAAGRGDSPRVCRRARRGVRPVARLQRRDLQASLPLVAARFAACASRRA